jgi:hypothetical protein
MNGGGGTTGMGIVVVVVVVVCAQEGAGLSPNFLIFLLLLLMLTLASHSKDKKQLEKENSSIWQISFFCLLPDFSQAQMGVRVRVRPPIAGTTYSRLPCLSHHRQHKTYP